MNRRDAYQRGIDAEAECASYLIGLGYRILGVRVRTSAGEIDIAAVDGDTLVIVEVKAHASEEASLYAVTRAKQKRLINAALSLMAEPSQISAGLGAPLPPNIRFDAMAATPGKKPHHVKDAWREE